MGQRLDLDTLLKTITPNVYFQPPTGTMMSYPCIVYNRDNALTEFANNNPYRHLKRYEVTVIDAEPDSTIPAQIAALPTALFNRFFVADNLNHDVFILYF